MSVRPVRRWFAARLVALHVLALVLASVMVLAGVWQWRSYLANQQQSSAATLAALARARPVPLETVMGADDAFPDDAVGKRVSVSGRYAATQFFVTDRSVGNRSGAWVLTPLLTTGNTAILVVRGWVAETTDPATAIPAGQIRIAGALEPPESADASGGRAIDRGRRISVIATSALVARVPFDLYSAYVIAEQQSPPSAPGLAPVLPSGPATSSWAGVRNVLYALQWWVFAAFVLYMWWRICREQTQVA